MHIERLSAYMDSIQPGRRSRIKAAIMQASAMTAALGMNAVMREEGQLTPDKMKEGFEAMKK